MAGHQLVPDLELVGAIWVIKGDMDWLANSLNLEHASDNFKCVRVVQGELHRAKRSGIKRQVWRGPNPWNDLAADASWRNTAYRSAEEWLLCHGGQERGHPFVSLPSVSGQTVMADTMHLLDLGLTHRCLGDTLLY